MKATFPGARPGRAVFEWILDRQFLVDRSAIPGAPSSIAVVSADPGGKSYTQHYFDSRGVVRVYRMTVASGVWTLLRDSQDFTPWISGSVSVAGSAGIARQSPAHGRPHRTVPIGSTTST
jgi:hypothetical protein